MRSTPSFSSAATRRSEPWSSFARGGRIEPYGARSAGAGRRRSLSNRRRSPSALGCDSRRRCKRAAINFACLKRAGLVWASAASPRQTLCRSGTRRDRSSFAPAGYLTALPGRLAKLALESGTRRFQGGELAVGCRGHVKRPLSTDRKRCHDAGSAQTFSGHNSYLAPGGSGIAGAPRRTWCSACVVARVPRP
jgi:hypothetical protein